MAQWDKTKWVVLMNIICRIKGHEWIEMMTMYVGADIMIKRRMCLRCRLMDEKVIVREPVIPLEMLKEVQDAPVSDTSE